MPLRRSEPVQLERPLRVLLEAQVTKLVSVCELHLRPGVPLVHVRLQPAHYRGIRHRGQLSAQRAMLVVFDALDGACRAQALAAAVVECCA
eukprot:CAMPEP_0184253380 /NCGR_PEP_ID=MMETSP0977-20130417/6661_1 /TAXON_ID=483370 /ORGANISM="non described non described, Strain CCMP2097" /LENGTH=90 /DNA_ID=CAMNT_0026558889 /DNA_START=208 /DNA_END=476 /DNA_ORIENTATION=+